MTGVSRVESDRQPGLEVGAGALAVLAATFVGSVLPAAAGSWRAAPVAAAVFIFALFPVLVWPVAFTGVLGYLLVDGFLVNEFGRLSWDGPADLVRMAIIGLAAVTGLAGRTVVRRDFRRG